ncbi:DUF1801 domain-containing protein [Kribbella sp. NPDC056861]|uniref:DUF1801 domain-containing protein n=1 Tax=Kribbella sp. NPDC056861 TaxID=3154857 RepID=UPI00344650B6
MAENKTVRTGASVDEFLSSVPEPRRSDARELNTLLTELAGCEPAMWGPSIVGFGDRRLVYASGKELDWFDVGYSPRKTSLTLYLSDGFDGYAELLARLGPHKHTVSCLHLKRLADADPEVLAELLVASIAAARNG